MKFRDLIANFGLHIAISGLYAAPVHPPLDIVQAVLWGDHPPPGDPAAAGPPPSRPRCPGRCGGRCVGR
ncbi:hypothetical protein [Paractinoplanes ferrugineus]|uniref:hypothetical protein n=1 Tax=Paractinoplanes ferrugineus TaxID=113564 RepID=UPI001942A2F1|nr:hypothetical protein [Actinoplanes ferrugineus]